MFVVKFSDNVEFKFTETQIKLIPYFKTMLESDFKTDFHINHASMGFEYLHTYATLDEIDIVDPQDKYLFVLKQCDFFCYDKLKELIEQKYNFRVHILSAVEDNIGVDIYQKLKYLGSFRFSELSIITPSKYRVNGCGPLIEDRTTIYKYNIIDIQTIYETSVFSPDDEINRILVERYKTKMKDYYSNLKNNLFIRGVIKDKEVETSGGIIKSVSVLMYCDERGNIETITTLAEAIYKGDTYNSRAVPFSSEYGENNMCKLLSNIQDTYHIQIKDNVVKIYELM